MVLGSLLITELLQILYLNLNFGNFQIVTDHESDFQK